MASEGGPDAESQDSVLGAESHDSVLSAEIFQDPAGPDAEFQDPERIQLLEALKTALGVEQIEGPTAWACLWLSDIECLQSLVDDAARPRGPDYLVSTFRDMERTVRIVQKCKSTKFIL